MSCSIFIHFGFLLMFHFFLWWLNFWLTVFNTVSAVCALLSSRGKNFCTQNSCQLWENQGRDHQFALKSLSTFKQNQILFHMKSLHFFKVSNPLPSFFSLKSRKIMILLFFLQLGAFTALLDSISLCHIILCWKEDKNVNEKTKKHMNNSIVCDFCLS